MLGVIASNYGTMTLTHGGGSGSSFDLQGGYDVDAGGIAPGHATRHVFASTDSSHLFTLGSEMNPLSLEWKNKYGSSMTSTDSSADDNLDVTGPWAILGNPVFTLGGTFISKNYVSSGNGAGTLSVLDPASGIWSSTSRDSSKNNFTKSHVVTGDGAYSHTDYGYPVSGTVTVMNSDVLTEVRLIANSYLNGARTTASNGVGLTTHSTGSLFSLSGSGGDTRTTVTSMPTHGGAGTQTTTLTIDNSAIEHRLESTDTLKGTVYRYDLPTGTLVPNRQDDFSHTVSDAGGRVQTDAKVVYEWQYDTVSPDGLSGANGSGKTVNQEISISDGNRQSDAMHLLSGPLEGVGAGTLSGTRTGIRFGHNNLTRTSKVEPGFDKWENWNPDRDVHYLSTTNSRLLSTFDSQDWLFTLDTAGQYNGHTHYNGSRIATDITGHETQWIDGLVDFDRDRYYPAYQVPPYDVTVNTNPGGYPATIPPTPFHPLSSIPEGPELPSGGPSAPSKPDLPAGVSELQTEVSNAASAGTSSNAATDAAFAELAEDTEALGDDDPADPDDQEANGTTLAATYGNAVATPRDDTPAPNVGAMQKSAEAAAAEPVPNKPAGNPGIFRDSWDAAKSLLGRSDAEKAADAEEAAARQLKADQRRNMSAGGMAKESGIWTTERHEQGMQAGKEWQSTSVDLMPVAGQAKGLYEAYTGRDDLADRNLTIKDRILAGIGAFGGPLVPQATLQEQREKPAARFARLTRPSIKSILPKSALHSMEPRVNNNLMVNKLCVWPSKGC